MNDDCSGKTKTENNAKNTSSERSNLESLCDSLSEVGNGTALKEQLHREKECLFQWAREKNVFFTEEEIRQRVESLKSLPGGNEHVVYYDENIRRVIKITCPPAFGARGSAHEYLKNLIRCNEYLVDDYKVEGVVEKFTTEANCPGNSIVISQPFIQGEKASETEIEEYMEDLGLQKSPSILNTYLSKDGQLIFSDVRPDNVIKSNQGPLFPIDIHIIEK